MADGRKNNGGHSTKGYAGRKSKAEELKVSAYAINAIKEEYGSQDEFWGLIAEKARDSRDHLKHLLEYAYGKPPKSIDVTSKGDSLKGFNVIIESE